MNLLTSLAVLLLSHAATDGTPVGVDGLQGLGDTRHHIVTSVAAEHDYHVFVGLPRSYNESADRTYPTLYILDGGALFPLLKGYYRFLRMAEESPEMILVAISYGTPDWRTGNNRGHDYTAPSDEREHWGGAADFQRFLGEELIPYVETRYRSSSVRRMIFGRSLGGQFVLFTAQTQPELFWGHIASNPALHRNLELFLAMQPEDASSRSSHLYVSSASNDDPVFRGPALEWADHWTRKAGKPWRLHFETLEGHNHFSTPAEAFRRAILWLFPDAGEGG